MIERGDRLDDWPAGSYRMVSRSKRVFTEAAAEKNVRDLIALGPGARLEPEHTETHWRWAITPSSRS